MTRSTMAAAAAAAGSAGTNSELIKTLPSPGRAIKTRLEQQLIIKL